MPKPNTFAVPVQLPKQMFSLFRSCESLTMIEEIVFLIVLGSHSMFFSFACKWFSRVREFHRSYFKPIWNFCSLLLQVFDSALNFLTCFPLSLLFHLISNSSLPLRCSNFDRPSLTRCAALAFYVQTKSSQNVLRENHFGKWNYWKWFDNKLLI